VTRNQLTSSRNVQTFYDPVSTVKFNVFNGNQWVSYDDEQSFTDKKAYLTSHCLSGAMIWAIDQDDSQYDALTGLLGEEAMHRSLLQGGDLSDGQKAQLASQYVVISISAPKCHITNQ
jgi:GH18 family chitinase